MMNANRSQGREGRGGDRRRVLRTWLPLVVLAAVVALVLLLLEFREAPHNAEAQLSVPAASAGGTEAADASRVVSGRGRVVPTVVVDITAEVAGRATFLHSGLRAGGVIPAGETVIRLDPADYELAARQARAAVAEAQAYLDAETAGAQMARRDWYQANPEQPPEASLVFREPQVRQARAALESAQARLAVAELQRQRTAVSLPFDVLVVEEKIDLGQYVPAGQPVAKAYGIDAFEVEVLLRDEDLAKLDNPVALLPTRDAAHQTCRTPAEVKATFAGRQYTWQGYVVGAAARMDDASQSLPVIVEIPRPLDSGGDRPALLPGTLVEVFITGAAPDVPATPEDAGTLQSPERR
jgi:RND family efflux transporter MFP subunit